MNYKKEDFIINLKIMIKCHSQSILLLYLQGLKDKINHLNLIYIMYLIIKMLKKNCTTTFLKQVFLSLFKTN